MRRAGRRAAAVLACVTLLVTHGVAYAADDDPEPTDWPSVQSPRGTGDSSDPEPVDWPEPEPL